MQTLKHSEMKFCNCFGRLKFLTILVNLILLSLGVVVMSIGLCHKSLCFSNHWYLKIIEESRKYFDITILRVSSAMLGVGAQMILLGILGLYGTWHNSLCILGTSLAFLVILLVQEITVIMWPVAYKNAIKAAMESVVTNEYPKNVSSTVQRFDAIQTHLNCCGSAGPLDWETVSHNSKGSPKVPDTASILNHENRTDNLKIPLSCCKNSSSQICAEYITRVSPNHFNDSIIHTQVNFTCLIF